MQSPTVDLALGKRRSRLGTQHLFGWAIGTLLVFVPYFNGSKCSHSGLFISILWKLASGSSWTFFVRATIPRQRDFYRGHGIFGV